jgi:hypothetical protein
VISQAALALHGRRSTLNFDLSEEAIQFALAHAVEKQIELGLNESG